jgi:hypothetical protein
MYKECLLHYFLRLSNSTRNKNLISCRQRTLPALKANNLFLTSEMNACELQKDGRSLFFSNKHEVHIFILRRNSCTKTMYNKT